MVLKRRFPVKRFIVTGAVFLAASFPIWASAEFLEVRQTVFGMD